MALGLSALLAATLVPGTAFATAPSSPAPATHLSTTPAATGPSSSDDGGIVPVFLELAGFEL